MNIRRKILFYILSFMLVIPNTMTGVHAKTESDEYKAAKAAVKSAQAEVDAAQAVIDKGAVGFYEANGDSVAVSIINDGNNTARSEGLTSGMTSNGAAGDATNLDLMESALSVITRCNQFRNAGGVSSLVVSDRLMALAQVNANHSAPAVAHWSTILNRYSISENLTYYYDDPFQFWYYEEVSWGGPHFQNIMKADHIVTGAALNTKTGTKIYCQDFGTSRALSNVGGYGTTYSVSDYAKRLSNYRTKINNNLKSAKKKLSNAKTYLENFEKAGFVIKTKTTEVKVGETVMPSIAYRYSDSPVTIKWSSAKTDFATVDSDSTVHGVRAGTVKITGENNGVKNTYTVQVLFTDVPSSGEYYSKPVYWAVGKKITYGFTDEDGLAREFRPQAECTRAQMVTFLWRLAGKPEPTSTECTFTDINEEDYYYKAVLWAAENEITKGYEDDNYTTFRPDETCLREHAVTFLYRYAGKPSVKGVTNSFTDVSEDDYYYKPVLWAASKNITKGYADDNYKTFRPSDNCLREHIVTFMYRYAK